MRHVARMRDDFWTKNLKGKEKSQDLHTVNKQYTIKMNIKEIGWKSWYQYSSGSGQGQVAGSCEQV